VKLNGDLDRFTERVAELADGAQRFVDVVRRDELVLVPRGGTVERARMQ
jgi:hypothetical protein